MHHDFITTAEEAELLQTIDALPWDATLRRRTQHYGRRFDYLRKSVGVDESPPPPECIAKVASRLCQAQPPLVPWETGADLWHELQITVNEYEPGVGIASHVDTHSAFADGIAALTLAAGCAFRMQRAPPETGSATVTRSPTDLAVWLPPRSLLVMTGAARYEWRHSISGRKYDRVQCADPSASGRPPPASSADEGCVDHPPAAGTGEELVAVSSEVDAGVRPDWAWVARSRRVSVTMRLVLPAAQRCACAWPLLCDSRADGAALVLPTRIQDSENKVELKLAA